VVPVVPVTGPIVPLPPGRVLGTQLGTGTPTGPCRVHPDVRLDVAVGGQAGVPLEGVAALVLRVRVVRPDAAFQLRVWPAGSTMPVDPAVMDAGGKVTEVTVPLGVGGQVSLQLSGAMAHLRADVLGYIAQPVQPVVPPPPAV
jgi:hypothetical protein